ncbi:hypothetical protein [Nocardia paucivorans]|uniref:hypothetical protein n=1 Tax=Nocardia paucivorans TaxID=114259 RepID=UPI00068741A3|nr:hypothetical protein [Nocardia paucivorans]
MSTTCAPGEATRAAHAFPMAAPSIHVRAVITWLVIFPLVALGMTVMAPFTGDWPPVLRALVLTAVVVPTSVYVLVPRLLAGYQRIVGRSTERSRRRWAPWNRPSEPDEGRVE